MQVGHIGLALTAVRNPVDGAGAAPQLADATHRVGEWSQLSAVPLATLMLQSGTPVEWQMEHLGAGNGNAAHFLMPGTIVGSTATVAAGIDANTPAETATGLGVKLNGGNGRTGSATAGGNAGVYGYRVRAKNAGGAWSAWKTLTLQIEYNAVTWGNSPAGFDNYDYALFGVPSATFHAAASTAQKKIILGHGARRTSGFGMGSSLAMPSAPPVIVEHEFPLAPIPAGSVSMSGVSYYEFNGFNAGGDCTQPARIYCLGSHHVTFNSPRIGLAGAADFRDGVDGIFMDGSATATLVITDPQVFHQRNGIVLTQGTDVTVTGPFVRYCRRAGFVTGPGQLGPGGVSLAVPDNFLVTDGFFGSPYRTENDLNSHHDGYQQLDDWKGYALVNGQVAPGYTNVGGINTGNATGVAKRGRFVNTVFGQADANTTWSAVRMGRAGIDSTADGVQFDNCIIQTSAPSAADLSSSKRDGDDGGMRNCEVIMAVTGQDPAWATLPYEYSINGPGGAANVLAFAKTSANWPDAWRMLDCHVSGAINEDGGPVNGPIDQLGTTEAYGSNRAAMAADYVVGDPRTYLEAVNWAALTTKAALVAEYLYALRRHDGTGVAHPSGGFNDLPDWPGGGGGGQPGLFDSTVTKFDSTTKTMDATS